MTNEFDAYAKRIIGHFEDEGYKLDSAIFQTVTIHDAHGKPLNAYTEPYIAELSKGDIKVRLEFNLVHEREAKKRKINLIALRPELLKLQDVLRSQKSLLDIAADLI